MATTTKVLHEQPASISVKGIKGCIDEQHIGRLRPTPKETPIPELKRRLSEDGYLFVKNLIPREDVLHVRRRCVLKARTHNLCEMG
jgi:phytanoyl-CoA hydroxylase